MVSHVGGKPGRRIPSRVLSDLRWAYKNFGKERVGTAQQMDFKEMYKEDRKGFLELLTKHETLHRSKSMAAAHQASKAEAASQEGMGQGGLSGGKDSDPGLDALVERVERLLRERAWEKE